VLRARIRRVGLAAALTVGLVLAALTYVALTLVAGTGQDGDAPAARSAARVSSSTPSAHDGDQNVGGVAIVDGKVTYSGAIKAPKPAGHHHRTSKKAAAPARPSSVPTSSATGTPALAREIGQLVITPLTGQRADASLLARVRSGQVGGVILFGDNIATTSQVKALADGLQAAARAGGQPGLLIMTDQEGGTVRRLPSQPPTTSAAQMGVAGTAATQGAATGAAMASLGLNVDLAPVADVPTTATNFLGTRAFGRSSPAVSRSACAFSAGLHQGGVASSLKHFPGLGRASGNTDGSAIAIQVTQSQLAADLAPYRRCANEPQTMVMVSNASYSGLTGSVPAVVSPNTYALLRSTLGFGGATISDSLNAAAVNGVADLAVKAVAAGLDLQLWTSVAAAQQAYRQMLSATKSGSLSRTQVRQAAARVLQLKQSLGLA
jgi:beta-N-acetylhexosaminidase